MTCMCGFNNPFILTDKGIGICLEMFLGEKSKFYQYLQTPRYMRQRMTPSHLALSMMKAWIESEFAPKSAQTTLLENIIFHGKVLYCLDAIFPTTADSIKIWYNKSEMDWANEHEKMVWAYFVDNDLLFETKLGIISKYTNDGPFTVDFAKESPGRMADYVGWQIIRKYMNKQEVVDLNELMNADASLILSESKYKP
jgi:hypothetical protein